jgi:RHS repeat-associated protein
VWQTDDADRNIWGNNLNMTGATFEQGDVDGDGDVDNDDEAAINAERGGTGSESISSTRTVSAYGNPWGFAGRRFDRETGHWHYRARVYDPDLGRFLTTTLQGDRGCQEPFSNPFTLATHSSPT